MNYTLPVMPGIHDGFTTEASDQLWSVWTFAWRPLRRRWCLVLGSVPSWTDEELAADPVLALTFRPSFITMGTVAMVMDIASRVPVPFVDTLAESPFYAGSREFRQEALRHLVPTRLKDVAR